MSESNAFESFSSISYKNNNLFPLTTSVVYEKNASLKLSLKEPPIDISPIKSSQVVSFQNNSDKILSSKLNSEQNKDNSISVSVDIILSDNITQDLDSQNISDCKSLKSELNLKQN